MVAEIILNQPKYCRLNHALNKLSLIHMNKIHITTDVYLRYLILNIKKFAL